MSSLFNFDTNHTKTPADMAGTRSQSKNHKRTPYETPSARGNNQKNEKKDKNKQNSSTASGSRDLSRDVNIAPNVNRMILTKLKKKLLPPRTPTKTKSISLTLTKQTLMNGRLLNWHKDTPSLSMLTTAKETTFLRRKNTLKTCSHHAIHC